MRLRRRKGFTLIELAIVIAVIAILLGAVVVGYRSLSSDARVNNILDFTEKVVTSTELAKLRCYPTFISIISSRNNALGYSDAFTHNSCAIWTGRPPTAGNNFLVAGVTVGVSFNAASGSTTFTYTGVGEIANRLRDAINAKFGEGKCNVSSEDVVTCVLP